MATISDSCADGCCYSSSLFYAGLIGDVSRKDIVNPLQMSLALKKCHLNRYKDSAGGNIPQAQKVAAF